LSGTRGDDNDAALATDVTALAADAIAEATTEAANPVTNTTAVTSGAPNATAKAACRNYTLATAIVLAAVTIRGFRAACERHRQHYTVHETPPANEQWNTTHALEALGWSQHDANQRATS
jgi:hypothetical protein